MKGKFFSLTLLTLFYFICTSSSFESTTLGSSEVEYDTETPSTTEAAVSNLDDASSQSNSKKPFQRLPTNVRPKHYDLILEPNLMNFTFSGSQVVILQVKEPTSEIVLNALDLEIKDVSVEASDGSSVAVSSVQLTKEDERLTISLDRQLGVGGATLRMSFEGTLNDKLKGFYRAKYPSTDGKTPDRFIATTQFEATSARLAFPCWDEPAVKATFNVTLVAPKDQVALSNMPVKEETTRDDGKKVVKFEKTPIMSTYLVAFIVGQFDHVETTSKLGVKVRAYTTPGKKEQGTFALDIAARSLDFYSEYFNVSYPLPKMDLVSISDFAAGAMENWGLTTYRDTAILIDASKSSSDRKQYVATVVAHEIAHQWFGNLVTMEWWTHLWLNEGFATFMEYLCVEKLIPEYSIWKQFLSNEYSTALRLDGLHSSHPIQVVIENPSEIDAIFDSISYAKGASVLRMLHSYIGDGDFKKGMSAYLNKYKYSNALTEDLWASLEAASDKPVIQVMNSWTLQKGYPVVNVTQRQDGPNRTITLTQEKFVSNGVLPDEEKNMLWQIPVSVITASSPDTSKLTTLMTGREFQVVVPNVKPDEWIKLNHESIGVYRVAYSDEMLKALIPAIESKTLQPLDRQNVLDDLFALVVSGKMSTVQVLRVLEAYTNEDDGEVWSSVTVCLSRLNQLTSHTEYHDAYKAWARKLLSKIRKNIGWEAKAPESHTQTLLRKTILSILVSLEDAATLTEARKLFEASLNKTATIDAEVKSVVYFAVAKQADESLFNSLLKLFRETDFAEEKNKISNSLGAVQNVDLIQRVLDFSISNEVRSQDTVSVLATPGSNKMGRELTWKFFQKNFDLFNYRYANSLTASNLVKAVTSSFASEEKAQEIESFFVKSPISGSEMAVKQTVESIRISANWLKRDSPSIHDYLKSH